jgi:hypothetical protein
VRSSVWEFCMMYEVYIANRTTWVGVPYHFKVIFTHYYL